jgi:hypothetical protein
MMNPFTFSWLDALRRFFDETRCNVVGIRGGGGYSVTRGGVVVAKGTFKNAATTIGRNSMLDNMFRTPTTYTMSLGLIDNASFTALAAGDVMSSHSGWLELTAYNEATRVAWSPSAASASVIVSTAKRFTMNDSKTIKGMFLNSVNTKGGTTGILWATGLLDATQAVVAADLFDLTYENELVAVA